MNNPNEPGARRDLYRDASMIDRAYAQEAVPPLTMVDTGACGEYAEEDDTDDDGRGSSRMLGYLLTAFCAAALWGMAMALYVESCALFAWSHANHWF